MNDVAMVLDRIGKSAPTQKKKIELFFSRFPEAPKELEKFLKMYRPFMEIESISIDTVIDSYLEMINQLIYARLEFIRTGAYHAQNQNVALNEVYSNSTMMKQYMLGVALSQFLWKHHFQMFMFYRESLKDILSSRRFLEVGCGHGLFLAEMLNAVPGREYTDVVDISEQSISMTKKLLAVILPDKAGDVVFYHSDIYDFKTQHKYDFITVGEVLEHVDKPLEMLAKLASFLAPGGRIFATTCANCPVVDHVFLFNNVQEIRDMIHKAGLEIENELVAPSEDKNAEYLEKFKIDISYAATLKHKTK